MIDLWAYATMSDGIKKERKGMPIWVTGLLILGVSQFLTLQCGYKGTLERPVSESYDFHLGVVKEEGNLPVKDERIIRLL